MVVVVVVMVDKAGDPRLRSGVSALLRLGGWRCQTTGQSLHTGWKAPVCSRLLLLKMEAESVGRDMHAAVASGVAGCVVVEGRSSGRRGAWLHLCLIGWGKLQWLFFFARSLALAVCVGIATLNDLGVHFLVDLKCLMRAAVVVVGGAGAAVVVVGGSLEGGVTCGAADCARGAPLLQTACEQGVCLEAGGGLLNCGEGAVVDHDCDLMLVQ